MMKTKYGIYLIYIALAIVTFAVYEPILHNGFISFDDGDYIFNNTNITTGLTLKNIVWAFTSIHANNYHPLTSISHMIDYQLFRLYPPHHHLINLIFHIANTALLFFVLSKLTNRIWPSAFAAALFALHPLHVESVAWASERKDVLCTFFWLLTMFAYWRYTLQNSKGRYILTLIMFTLGLLSKPMIVTLPFVLLLVDYWPLGRFKDTSISKLVMEKIPFFVLSGILSLITLIVQGKMGLVASTVRYPLSWRIENTIVSYITYIGRMFWPFNLAIFYPHPKDTLDLIQVLASLLILVIITVLVIWKIRSKPYLAFGWFWFIGTLIPVIGLCQVGMQAWANRYTYIPYIGLFIALIWWFSDLCANLKQKKIIFSVLSSLILLILGVRTYVQTLFWNTDILLYSYAINVTKDNWFAHYMLGQSLSLKGEYNAAIDQLMKSIEIHPDNANAQFELAQAYLMTGDVNEAQIVYNKLLVPKSQDDLKKHKRIVVSPADYKRIRELYVSSTLNLATIHFQKGNLDEAEKWFKEALTVMPDSKNAKEGLEQIQILKNNKNTDANG